MVGGNWFNQDGLNLQFGTSKAIPEIGGDYLVYGETREVEQLIPLVPMTIGTGNPQVPAPAASFSGTTTPAAAGIQSLTTLFPLAQVAPITAASSSVYTFVSPQIFIEQVEVICLSTATTGGDTAATLSVGLVTTSPQANANAQFAQITSTNNSATGTQILNAFPIFASSTLAVGATVGSKTIYTGPTYGFTYAGASPGPAVVATGGGGWIGVFSPIPSNSITPVPQSAWLSSVLTNTGGALTSGLLKLRIKYVMFGAINY